MHIEAAVEGPYTVIRLAGEVDMHYSPRVRDEILKYLNGRCNVLVDLSGVSYMDSSGIATLVEGLQLARSMDLKFGLVGVHGPVRQVLELARLDRVFAIHDSVEDRLRSDRHN